MPKLSYRSSFKLLSFCRSQYDRGQRSDGSYTFYKEDGTPVHNLYNQSSFSTYTITKVNNLIKVDKDFDLHWVAPLSCGFLTGYGTVVNGLKPKTASSIVIFGTGAVGLSALMATKIEGYTTIIAFDIHDSRLELAKELGATHMINRLKEDVVERVREITNGMGVHYSVDTTGVSAVMKAGVDVLGMMVFMLQLLLHQIPWK